MRSIPAPHPCSDAHTGIIAAPAAPLLCLDPLAQLQLLLQATHLLHAVSQGCHELLCMIPPLPLALFQFLCGTVQQCGV